MNTYAGAVSMERESRAMRTERGTMHRLLRVPLSSKLAGANLVIVLLAWGVGFTAHRTGAADWRLLSVMTVALGLGLIVNLTLVAIALRPIRDLEQTAMRVWAGDLETRVPQSPVADEDLAQVGGTLNFLLNALAEDRARVRMLASEVVRTGDRERSRVGKELHETVAQSLAAIRYQLMAIERDATDEATIEKIQAVRSSAGELLEQVRLLSHEVHPQILDDLGLVPALRQLARKADARAAVSVNVESGNESDFAALPGDAIAALYHVARESVANAIRHGAATAVNVCLSSAGGDVVMQIDDNGSGFDVERVERDGRAMGLFTMRERIALLSGTLDIESSRDQGTSVRIRLPKRPAVSAHSGNAARSFQQEAHHAR